MKTKLTNLKTNDYFIFNSILYKKLSDFNKNGDCLRLDDSTIIKIPLMTQVIHQNKDNIEIKKKKKKVDINENINQEMYNTGFRDRWDKPRDMQPSSDSINSDRSEEIGNS